MNNKNILDLTLRLSQALDQNYDVVSMDTVLSVISALEGATITKEQLETTRLAKYINQLRRRTNCENLARRAKSLLKRWREMVGIQQHHTNESSVSIATSSVSARPVTSTITSSTATAFNIPVNDNAVSTSHLANPQISYHQFQSVKQHQSLPYSQPTSPANLQEKSSLNEFLISVSNPAPATNLCKSSNSNLRKKKRLRKTSEDEQPSIHQQQLQPTSFANLLTGLGGYNSPLPSFSSTRKTFRDKANNMATTVKPVETYVIEHSSNSNSDIVCLPSNTTRGSNITSAINVPPIVIDLQDTNSSMTSLVSKNVTNAPFSAAKQTSKKSKKEKKRKERDLISRQSQPLQDCDDNNTSTASYYHKRPSEMLLVDEKSHSVCPTISNISEILSLSNSSMSSMFPSADGISKITYVQDQSELPSGSEKVKKSDLTFAGKFKQITNSSSIGCDVLNYSNDNMNINIMVGNSPNHNKFSLFGGGGATNSNDSTSNSRTSQFNIAINAIKHEVSSNSKQNKEDALIMHDINEKSMSNLSNKGNSSIDNIASSAATFTAQQQQLIDLTTIDLSSEQKIKQPKKRGRKKGSKGVDSVIAKEAGLTSQMLISSLSAAGKKVKTTKELYAEMENRKLRNVKSAAIAVEVPSSSLTTWTSQQLKTINSPRTSYCSDIAESDSCTMTSEPSRDSSGIQNKTVSRREMPLDSNSNYSQHGSAIKITDICGEGTTSTTIATSSSSLAIIHKLKHDLQEILKHLPPPLSKEEIEYDCLNSMTPCTCVVEVSEEPHFIHDLEEHIADTNLSGSSNVLKYDKKDLQTEQKPHITDDKFLSEKQTDSVDHLLPPTKPKKSIFDLDFDDDEDPLNSIIADIVGKGPKESDAELTETPETSPTGERKFVLPHKDEYIFDISNLEKDYSADIEDPPPSSADLVLIPSYEVKYDPECEARNRFEIQTQKITKFHIDTLHNCFIPNVNGNWNYAYVFTNNLSNTKKYETNDNDFEEKNSDSYNVVPFYSSEIKEKIVKDLSQVKFTTKFKHKSWNAQDKLLFHIPFMGVSRLPEILKVKSSKTECLTEKEKENIDVKLNVCSLAAVKNCLENESVDAKDLKEVPIKIKKRLKKSATSTKCAKTKRLKLSLAEQSQCDFDNSGCIWLQDKNGISPENFENSTSDSDTEIYEHSVDDDEFVKSQVDNNELEKIEVNVYHHEVGSHDISDSSNGQNHIVLAVKKTSSKTNPPLNTLSELSPVYSDIYENLNSVANKENTNATSREKQNQDFDRNNLKKEDNIDGFLSKDDNFFGKLKRIKSHKPSESSANFKLHNSLFYHEEVRPLVKHGTQLYRENIFQISSCSSGCSDEETITNTPLIFRRRVRSISSSSSHSSIEKNHNHKYDVLTLNLQQDFVFSEFKKQIINTSTDSTKNSPKSLDIIKLDFQQLGTNNDIFLDNDDDDLPAENNLMLVSFNHIYSTRDENSTYLNNEQLNKHSNERKYKMLKQQHQNCDDSNLNNNFNLIKYVENKSSVSNNIINNNSSIINYLDSNITLRGNCKNSRNQDDDGNKNVKLQEHQSGIRAVDDDVNDEQGNNCGHLQEFKEWHEVLQLRSYNNELLTVLPYVVLD